MPTILCFDDQTCSLATRIACLRAHGYKVVITDRRDGVLEALTTSPIDAAILNCHEDAAARMARLIHGVLPAIPILMLTAYCGLPCHLTGVVTACVSKGESPNALVRHLETLLGRTGGEPIPTA